MKRFIVTAAALAVATVLVIAGVGQAGAAPIQHLSTTGNNFGTFGDHSFCRGSINIGLDSPPGKRGVVRVTATSHGFTGNGPSWERNPRCKLLINNVYTGGRGLYRDKWVTATFGPRPGEKKSWDVPTGSGLVVFTVNTHSDAGAVRPLQSYGFGAYLLVP